MVVWVLYSETVASSIRQDEKSDYYYVDITDKWDFQNERKEIQ